MTVTRWLSSPLFVFSLLSLGCSGATSEPTYHDKPLGYWIDALCTADDQSDGQGRGEAIFALLSIGKPAVAKLANYVEGTDPARRPCAIKAIGYLAEWDELTPHDNPHATGYVRKETLGDDFRKYAVPQLIAIIEEDDLLRESAIMTLGAIGPVASEAVPVLERLRDEYKDDDTIRELTTDAIGQITRSPTKK